MTQATEVLLPTSADEAVALFGDGSGVTIVAGGTIVLPEITHGRIAPTRALMLSGAGLDTLDAGGPTVTIGAALPVARLAELAQDVEALARCALGVADYEIRRQGTVGGNVCAGAGRDAPRGDLQGPLLALDASARSIGPDGEATEPLVDFLGHRAGRLLLDLSFEKPAASAFAAIEYPHTHEYTVLAVTGVRTAGGEVRLAATGLADHGTRLPSAEAAAGDPDAAGAAAVDRRQAGRRRAGLGLVPRADAPGARAPCPVEARGGPMKLTVNGTPREIESAPLTTLLNVLREELGVTSPKAGCAQGGCGACTVLVDGEPQRACLTPVGAIDGSAVTTVEGLGAPESLSALQQAFTHHYAAQCGFCTSGMLMAAEAYIARGGTDDREAIQEALAGHVCRCTGYVKIIDAVAAAARGDSFDLTVTAAGTAMTNLGGVS